MYIQLILIGLSLYSFILRTIHTDISWISIYYNGFVNMLFVTYFIYFNSLHPSFINVIFMSIFSIIFIMQSILPIKRRMVTEDESEKVTDVHNLKKAVKIINKTKISEKIDISFLFEILILGTYQPKYMLKVLSYLIRKNFIELKCEGIVVHKHVNAIMIIFLYLGIVPPHKKIAINIMK